MNDEDDYLDDSPDDAYAVYELAIEAATAKYVMVRDSANAYAEYALDRAAAAAAYKLATARESELQN